MGAIARFDNADIEFHHSIDERPDTTDFRMHTHSKYELYYFVSGNATYHVEGNEYQLKPGCILVIRGAESHYISVSDSTPYERIAIHFSPELIRSVDPDGALLQAFNDRELGQRNLYLQSVFEGDLYLRLTERLMNIGENDGYPQIIAVLFSLLGEIRTAFLNRSSALSDADSDTRAHKIITYINRNLRRELSLDKICENFYISKAQLCRIFKRSTGSTAWSYITVKRLTLARELLRSGVSPSSVCFECGFSDYSVFYRSYVSHFGHSPKCDVSSRE